jgi:hypothetical protein
MAPASDGVATGLTLDLVCVDACKAAVGGSDRCWPTVQSWRNVCCGVCCSAIRGWWCWMGPVPIPLPAPLWGAWGFAPISATLRLYRGTQPEVSLAAVYGLACLELG